MSVSMPTPQLASQPANALEQRVYDLLRPYRDEAYATIEESDQSSAVDAAVKCERKMIVLAQNIGFLAHNHFHDNNRSIGTENLLIVMRGWTGNGVGTSGGAMAVLVRYPGLILGIVKANFAAGANVVEGLYAQVDVILAESI